VRFTAQGNLAVLSRMLSGARYYSSLLLLDWLHRRTFGFLPWCKNLFAKEHNDVAETYQKSSFSVLAGCLATAFSAQADIVIGGRAVTGPNATYGDQYWHGATQAAEDINAAGGINGEKIKLVQGMMPASLNKPSRSPTVWSTRKKSTRLSAISAPHPPCPPLRCIAMRALLPSPRLNQPTDHRTWHERYVPHVWPR
jgi:hypothetical protein